MASWTAITHEAKLQRCPPMKAGACARRDKGYPFYVYISKPQGRVRRGLRSTEVVVTPPPRPRAPLCLPRFRCPERPLGLRQDAQEVGHRQALADGARLALRVFFRVCVLSRFLFILLAKYFHFISGRFARV